MAYGYPVVLAQFVKKADLSVLNILGILVENQLTGNVYSCTFNSLLVLYMSILMPVPHCFEYYSSVVSFEIDICESFIFVLFQDCLSYLGVLYFYLNFRIDCPFL